MTTTIIHSKEAYITFNEKGEYRLMQGEEALAATAHRKDKIVRRKRLPNWCLKALEEGKWIKVSELVPQGTCREDFYLQIKGQAITPQRKVKTKEEKDHYSDTIYARREVFKKYEKEVLYFEDFELQTPCWSGWELKEKTYGKELLNEDFLNFKKENPFPETVKVIRNDFLETIEEYHFKDDFAIKEEVSLFQPHTEGYYFTYGIDDDYHPYIRREELADHWAPVRVKGDKLTLAYIKKELIDSYTTTENSGKYESNDGMRKAYDVYRYKVDRYDVTLSDGSHHRVSFKELLEVW